MVDSETDLTRKLLKSLVRYSPETGIFTRLVARSNRVKVGETVGRKNDQGYLTVNIDGFHYRLHRLAWFYVTGRWPVGDIDHINGDRSDNRWKNLREATRSQNMANMNGGKGRSGIKGVAWNSARKLWQAQIVVNGKCIYLGLFSGKEDAAAARREAAFKHHGSFARL